ncbi:phosphoribosylanthranilate isomerase [Paenochrobactrum glaciei]|uniref:N-(5'-phosphoribosyl)anthranilate isomerase n=1 Tax=Paenochrobactrum glaciei TaxID=486407 RepID=A0ABP3QTY3_9HYPH
MNFDLKICGLKTPEAVSAVLEGGATHIGFIFFPKSPRHIGVEEAGCLRVAAQGRAQVVAVTVDADDDYLAEIVNHVRPDILQLHGQETPERVKLLKERFGLPVIKAFAIRNFDDLEAIKPYKGIADRFLFDAKPPKGSELPGGNGVSFDWELLTKLDGDVDYMLSGGLNAGNIAQALVQTGAQAIDVSSGVEARAGEKDVRLIEEFLQAVGEAKAMAASQTKA